MTLSVPQVTIVIVTYESRNIVGLALDALYKAYDAGLAEVVVVDNASSDGTADFIAKNYPWITLVRSDKNLGYGRGCNAGLQNVRTPYVLILNPDAEITLDTLQTLIDFMGANKKAGIVAPAIIEGEKSLQAAGLMTTPASILRAECGWSQAMPESQPITPGSQPFQTSWICGAVMLIQTDLFQKLAGFDPRFFLYFEETDFCRRATQRGAEIWAVGEAVTKHIGGASAKNTGQTLASSCIADHYYCSRFYYLVKHFGWIRAVGSESIVWVVQLLRNWLHRLTGRQVSTQNSPYKRPFLRFPKQPEDVS